MLPDAEADLVVAATSFHWVEPEIGAPKALSVLRPGGSDCDLVEPLLRPARAGRVQSRARPDLRGVRRCREPRLRRYPAGGVLDSGLAGGGLRTRWSPSAFRGTVDQTTEDIVVVVQHVLQHAAAAGRRAEAGARPDRRRGRRPVRRARATHVSGRALHRAKAERLSSAGLADAEHGLDDAVVAGAAAEVARRARSAPRPRSASGCSRGAPWRRRACPACRSRTGRRRDRGTPPAAAPACPRRRGLRRS